jgi:hypothetical protein
VLLGEWNWVGCQEIGLGQGKKGSGERGEGDYLGISEDAVFDDEEGCEWAVVTAPVFVKFLFCDCWVASNEQDDLGQRLLCRHFI